ncbi:MAG TPA: hypothetical protein VLE47_00795 [Candidatus Saccharimonadales bacterium]|nr:hypothetical protein [Candidatus Saccharimonadales bacterium]
MTGLPYLADNIKSLLRWAIIVVASLFGIWLLWLTVNFSYHLVFPPPPPGPDIAFGKITQPFVYNSGFGENLFVLDTPGQEFPNPGNLLTIYATTASHGQFTSLDSAKKLARGAGLDSEPQTISENERLWTSTRNSSKTLKLNIVNGNFLYHYDWNADPKALEGVFKTTDAAIISKAKAYLNTFKSLKEDLKTGTARISFYKLAGNSRSKVSSYSEANAVMVELFRKGISNTLPFVETYPQLANVNVWISPAQQSDKQLLEINFTYWDFQKDNKATYPPKSGSQAYSELKSGKAYLSEGADSNFQSITIAKVSLAYYNPSTQQQTLQPVYVFSGTGIENGVSKNFVAYVPAISSQYQR